jgi:hypothetical protein
MAQNGRTKKQEEAYKLKHGHVCLGKWCLLHSQETK